MLSAKRKKIIRSWIILTMLLVLAALAVWIIFEKILGINEKFVRYPEFGIGIPAGYSIHGIDVSRYQKQIEWDEVKNMQVRDVRLGFVFIKATEGIGNVDPQFQRNWKKSKQAGMIRGAYHFFIASKDGKMQAQHFIRQVKLEPGDLPPVLDVEQRNYVSVAELKREVKKWLAAAEEYYGVKPIIYTNVDFYNQNLGSEFDSYPLWVAHYYETHQPRIKRGWHFWQHHDGGRVNGIRHPVDFNVFAGDSLEFRNFLVK
jgi:lysozyme